MSEAPPGGKPVSSFAVRSRVAARVWAANSAAPSPKALRRATRVCIPASSLTASSADLGQCEELPRDREFADRHLDQGWAVGLGEAALQGAAQRLRRRRAQPLGAEALGE